MVNSEQVNTGWVTTIKSRIDRTNYSKLVRRWIDLKKTLSFVLSHPPPISYPRV